VTLDELLATLPPRYLLAIALGLSVIMYALGANLAHVKSPPRSQRLRRFLGWARTAWVARAAGEMGRWLYYLGLPYATLYLGINTVRALGVWNLDWMNPLLAMLVLAGGAIVILFWVWRPYARTEHPHAVDESRWSQARHVVELIYQQAHWALNRSGPILWVGDFYLGSFLGLVLTFIEAWSNPTVRASVHDTTRADAPLWTGSLAIVSTLVFIFTQNLWYCLAIHLLLDLGLRPVIGFPRVATDADTLPPVSVSSESME
jgi:hypothetical protein